MNASSTVLTAFLRGFYLALIAGLTAGLTTLQTTNDNRAAVITGLLAGLAILGARGLGEGGYDASRQNAGDVKSSDVQPGNAGKAV